MKERYTDLQKAQLDDERAKDLRVKQAGGARGVLDNGWKNTGHARLEVTGAQVEEARQEMKDSRMEKQLNLKKFTDEMFKAQAEGDYSAVRMLALTIADKMKEKPNTFFEKITVGDFTIQTKLEKGVITVEFSGDGGSDRFKLPLKGEEDGKELAKSIFYSAISTANNTIGNLGDKGVAAGFSNIKSDLASAMRSWAARK